MSSSSSSMRRQVSALVRRYAIFIARGPINSLIRLLVWPGVLFGLCLWVLNNSTDADDATKNISKSVFAGGVAPILLFTTAFHVYSFCENFVKDKATGFKSLMISMGLRRASYHSANALCMLLLLLPLTTIIAVVSKIYIFDDSHSSTMTIILMFTLFTVQLISFTFALVSFITSTSYVALVFILFGLEQTLDSATKSLVEKSGDTWRPFILFSAGFSPYQSIRIFSDSYVVNKNDGTSDYQNNHVSQPTYLILFAMIFWSIATVFLAKCIKRVYLGKRKGLLANICLFMDKENNTYSELDEEQEEEMTKRSSVYFEKPARNRDVGIRVQRVTKTFEGVPAVSELSLEVYKGETTMLLGHNGAGKTTLMNIILGLLRPDTGSVTIKRGRGDGPAVGVCPQTSVLDDDLSVQQHVGLFVDIKSRLEGHERSEHMRQILEEVSLGLHADKRPGELSGGMKRKLSLAIATVGKSDVLILDEPSSGLDPDSRMFVWNAIRRYRTDRTVLLSTQHMEEADYLGDRIAIMSEGRIVCCGSSIFLNNLFGSGYKLRVECEASKKTTILEHIKNFFKESKQADTGNTEHDEALSPNERVDFVVELKGQDKSEDSELQMIKMLEDIETNSEKLGIKSFGLKSSSIEDVMLQTSQYFSLKPKDATQVTIKNTEGHLKTLADSRGSNVTSEGHIFRALIMKHIRTNLANWKTFVFFRLAVAGLGAWYIGDGLNPQSSRYLRASLYTPRIINVFMVLHFIYYPVLERATKFKIVQLTSKASYLSYWQSQALIDLVTVVTNTILINVMFAIQFNGHAAVSMWTIHAILTGATFLFGLSAMMFSYVLSTILNDPKNAIGYNVIISNLGVFAVLIVIILRMAMPKTDLNWLSDTSTYVFVTLFPSDAFHYVQWGLVRQGYIKTDASAIPWVPPKDLSPVVYGLLALTIQIIAYMALIPLIEVQNFDLEWYSRPSNLYGCLFGAKKPALDHRNRPMDDDVVDETAKATSVIHKVPRDTFSLVAAALSKSYYIQSPVVEGLSLTVGKAECFGLLGVNGAGKSTTFSMLIAESAPDAGKVWANGLYSHNSISRYRENLGYDSERNPDISLSPYEALYLMARLRKVPESRIESIIDSVLELLEMSQHSHKLASDLSGGTKRKLALGMALIGNPDLLVLDEPTAGVDPVARRGVWRLLRTLRAQKSIIISSHAMEECEAICDRISVMARGRLRCVGTFLHLRSKFAQGCSLKIQFGNPASPPSGASPGSGAVGDIQQSGAGIDTHSANASALLDLKQILEASVGANSVKLADRNVNSASFVISDNRVRRSLLFKIMREFTQKHPNISYMINDSSLEDIFISIAREQQESETQR